MVAVAEAVAEAEAAAAAAGPFVLPGDYYSAATGMDLFN
jgi:hypothetical protein